MSNFFENLHEFNYDFWRTREEAHDQHRCITKYTSRLLCVFKNQITQQVWEGRCWPKGQTPHSRKRTGEFSPNRPT